MVSNRKVVFPIVPSLTMGIDKVTRKADNVYVDGQAMAEGLFAVGTSFGRSMTHFLCARRAVGWLCQAPTTSEMAYCYGWLRHGGSRAWNDSELLQDHH